MPTPTYISIMEQLGIDPKVNMFNPAIIEQISTAELFDLWDAMLAYPEHFYHWQTTPAPGYRQPVDSQMGAQPHLPVAMRMQAYNNCVQPAQRDRTQHEHFHPYRTDAMMTRPELFRVHPQTPGAQYGVHTPVTPPTLHPTHVQPPASTYRTQPAGINQSQRQHQRGQHPYQRPPDSPPKTKEPEKPKSTKSKTPKSAAPTHKDNTPTVDKDVPQKSLQPRNAAFAHTYVYGRSQGP